MNIAARSLTSGTVCTGAVTDVMTVSVVETTGDVVEETLLVAQNKIDVAIAAQHANDQDVRTLHFIENDVIADWKHAKASAEIRTFATGVRIQSQQSKSGDQRFR
jgi:hypothetical protein